MKRPIEYVAEEITDGAQEAVPGRIHELYRVAAGKGIAELLPLECLMRPSKPERALVACASTCRSVPARPVK